MMLRTLQCSRACGSMALMVLMLLAVDVVHCSTESSTLQVSVTSLAASRKLGLLRALLDKTGIETKAAAAGITAKAAVAPKPPTPRVVEVPPGKTPPKAPAGKTPPTAPPGKIPPAAPAGKTPPTAPPGKTPPKAPPGKTPPKAPPGKTPPKAPPGKTPPGPKVSPPPRRPKRPLRPPPPPPRPVVLGLQPRGDPTPFKLPPGTPISPPPAAFTLPPSEVDSVLDQLYPGANPPPAPEINSMDPDSLLAGLFGIPLPRPPPWKPGAPAPPPSPPPPPEPVPNILITPTPGGPSLAVDIINQLFGGDDSSIASTDGSVAGSSNQSPTDESGILGTLFPGEGVADQPPPPPPTPIPSTLPIPVPSTFPSPPPMTIGTVACGLLLVEGQQCGGLGEAPASITPVDDKWAGICCGAGLRCVRVSSLDWRCRLDN